ncbi:helix-turn-helix domain-containing protein [Actinoplanes sp. LDG1-01]|uniref:Helix-turn-helix domain-containing protein n=1 Tax=Paractinoplanes lichenicola TaxID=2802976 RepID=A0ABS1VNX0_9ACTN|nr:helix-turn-helix domain-containing protein [Actinoplanes lichenicola]
MGIDRKTGYAWRSGRTPLDVRRSRERAEAVRQLRVISARYLNERIVTADRLREGATQTAIAAELGRPRCTISREIGRNARPDTGRPGNGPSSAGPVPRPARSPPPGVTSSAGDQAGMAAAPSGSAVGCAMTSLSEASFPCRTKRSIRPSTYKAGENYAVRWPAPPGEKEAGYADVKAVRVVVHRRRPPWPECGQRPLIGPEA